MPHGALPAARRSARRAGASRISRRRSRPGRAGGLVSASRSIAGAHLASGGGPPEAAARAEAERLRELAWELSGGRSARAERPRAAPPGCRGGLRPFASLCVVHRRAPFGVRGAPRRGCRPAMIITVTLNAAIDKSLAVPELPARAPPPHRRTAHDGRRQGRQHRPHAEGARPARDRDRASRAAPPARTSSSSSPRSRSSTTSCASARSRARTPRCSTRPAACRPRSTNAVPPVTAREVELFRDKLLYLARGAAIVVLRGLAAARRRARPLRVADPRPRALGGDDRGRHRRRAAAPRGARRARPRLAERARGRGAGRARVLERGGALARDGARSPRSARAK